MQKLRFESDFKLSENCIRITVWCMCHGVARAIKKTFKTDNAVNFKNALKLRILHQSMFFSHQNLLVFKKYFHTVLTKTIGSYLILKWQLSKLPR